MIFAVANLHPWLWFSQFLRTFSWSLRTKINQETRFLCFEMGQFIQDQFCPYTTLQNADTMCHWKRPLFLFLSVTKCILLLESIRPHPHIPLQLWKQHVTNFSGIVCKHKHSMGAIMTIVRHYYTAAWCSVTFDLTAVGHNVQSHRPVHCYFFGILISWKVVGSKCNLKTNVTCAFVYLFYFPVGLAPKTHRGKMDALHLHPC